MKESTWKSLLFLQQLCLTILCMGCKEPDKRLIVDGISSSSSSNPQIQQLENRIQELVTELGQVETQLRTQHQSMQSSIDQLTKITQQQTSTIYTLTSKLQDLSGSHNSTQSAIDQLTTTTQQHTSSINSLTSKVQDLSSSYHTTQSVIDQLTRITQRQTSSINSLTSKVQELSANHHSDGAIFTRWGHHHCPDSDSEEVYSGISSGSHPSFTGGAANFLCLPSDHPDLKGPAYSGHAFIYGVEYGKTTFLGSDGNDVPCAVCRSLSATSSLMIPAKTTCNSGWKRQYYGYLMASDPSLPGSSNYICVDITHQTVVGGEHMYVDKMIYPVQAKCGALHCPPYHDGSYLYCVVCTK